MPLGNLVHHFRFDHFQGSLCVAVADQNAPLHLGLVAKALQQGFIGWMLGIEDFLEYLLIAA
ncbi:hypothetical protein FQZ97_1154630 [compost metagenome]